ncbi:NAD(P)-dependent dehydrogenase (short-subunit alcohol dehydrogenase family) [Allocatelliglobosispora scoriae]|uniref:NAD(P)-dependent dehydrogenase (Short-subunit alcohol dehydrogenase family) n=1 Tax=Allocatelliglobosispora scoriae TaxID=643052 RepID=A0A841BZI2_9ACTN|nr:SDR family oxidoreductase [Allocatelliglobosispora scoriae]MBB5873544.1 NAD(P)-dependent dehydrogenase (short-subunit alcohol dehydrogenase family) [Allocatelliglobosispora scoriae]
MTGCSSGLGRALAENLARTGEQAVVTARNPATLADLAEAHPATIAVAALDVRDEAQCQAAVDLAGERFGGIDVLVNNAGYGQFGSVEEVSEQEVRDQLETNLLGPWRLLRMVLPQWRERRSGHSILVSSTCGSMSLPGLSAYAVSKFALEGLGESLALEAAHLGVKSTILQLGGFATSYGTSLVEPARRIEDYAVAEDGVLAGTRAIADYEFTTPVELFPLLVRKVAAMAEPPLRVPFGRDIEVYLAAALRARHQDFEQALAEGRHTAEWVTP